MAKSAKKPAVKPAKGGKAPPFVKGGKPAAKGAKPAKGGKC